MPTIYIQVEEYEHRILSELKGKDRPWREALIAGLPGSSERIEAAKERVRVATEGA